MELSELASGEGATILLVVADGLGGMADAEHGTELEEAATPNLDRLAAEGATGLLEPVGPGITPGSGPGHLALFGYDPLAFELGRGVLSAAGLDVELGPGDVAARVVAALAERVAVPGVELAFHHERGHRLLVVLRGEGLDPHVSDTDPQRTGQPPLEPRALEPAAERTAEAVAVLSAEARRVLAEEPAANGLLLRGFDAHRELPSFASRTGMRAAAAAVYPMYRGIARLLGFEVLGPPHDLEEQARLLEKHRDQADFLFVHYKDADAAGEDGDRGAKVAAIERLDAAIPDLVAASGAGGGGGGAAARPPRHAVAAGGALLAPGPRAGARGPGGPRRGRALRRAVVPGGRARPASGA